jgi:hydroxymethylpyrimidine/phosphomethylpyrimidine kinase
MNIIPAMTIGGSDPSGGAGIQTDIKTFQSLGLHPLSIITSITVQNTQVVKNIIPIEPNIIQNQIETIMEDIPVQFVKTGLLYESAIAKEVAHACERYKWDLVVDPVLIATSGDALASSDLKHDIKKILLPISRVITPNIPEAETLTNTHIETVDDMKNAAKKIHSFGAENVIVKGGHLSGSTAYDVLYDGTTITVLSLPKIPQRKAHGSGCTFSALLTGYLAKGLTIHTAFSQAKSALWQMIHTGYNIGKGSDVLHVSLTAVQDAPINLQTPDHAETWIKLFEIVSALPKTLPTSFIPEVGCNIGYALPHAKTRNDVCAIDGRIVRTNTGPHRCGPLRFGASKHIASIILVTIRKYPTIRSAMNIKYTPSILSLCKKADLIIASFHREEEPKHVSSTMDWGTTTALNALEVCPDIIYDVGGMGKEPMIRILGTDPQNIMTKLKSISNVASE